MSEGAVEDLGEVAPPRRNGELVFEAPWESRAFGIAVALSDIAGLDFDRFRGRLIGEIQRSPVPISDGYYGCWLRALEAELTDQLLVTPSELEARARTLAAEHVHH